MDLVKCKAKSGKMIAAAPEELRPVLKSMKMSASMDENKKSLASHNTEMMAKTLGFLLGPPEGGPEGPDHQGGDQPDAPALRHLHQGC